MKSSYKNLPMSNPILELKYLMEQIVRVIEPLGENEFEEKEELYEIIKNLLPLCDKVISLAERLEAIQEQDEKEGAFSRFIRLATKASRRMLYSYVNDGNEKLPALLLHSLRIYLALLNLLDGKQDASGVLEDCVLYFAAEYRRLENIEDSLGLFLYHLDCLKEERQEKT